MDISIDTWTGLTEATLTQLADFERQIPQVGTEGLQAIFRSMGDAIQKVAYNLKNLVTGGFGTKLISRSELREYLESHATTVRSLGRIPDATLKDHHLFIPYGMRCTYPEAITLLTRLYQQTAPQSKRRVRVADWLQVVEAELDRIQLAIARNEPIAQQNTATEEVVPIDSKHKFVLTCTADLAGTVEAQARQLLPKFSDNKRALTGEVAFVALLNYTRSVFARGVVSEKGVVELVDQDSEDQTIEMVRFHTQFNSLANMNTALKQLTDLDQYLSDISQTNAQGAKISTTLDNIIVMAPHSEQVNRATLNALAADVNLVAKLITLYGYAAAVHISMGHNLTRSLARLCSMVRD